MEQKSENVWHWRAAELDFTPGSWPSTFRSRPHRLFDFLWEFTFSGFARNLDGKITFAVYLNRAGEIAKVFG